MSMKNRILSILMTFMMILPCMAMAFTPFQTDPQEPTGLGTPVGKILGAIQLFGYAIAIGMLIYIGIKYMMSSANEKAELKQVSIYYIIGAIVIIASSTIFRMLTHFVEGMK